MLGVSVGEDSCSHRICKQKVFRPPVHLGLVSASPETQVLRAEVSASTLWPTSQPSVGCQGGGEIVKIPGLEPLQLGGSPGGK